MQDEICRDMLGNLVAFLLYLSCRQGSHLSAFSRTCYYCWIYHLQKPPADVTSAANHRAELRSRAE
jgi:hypothetical protein